jgi:hypothetical protein
MRSDRSLLKEKEVFMYNSKLRLEKKPEFKLTVDTADDGAEVILINSQFERVDRKCGRLVEFVLPEGLYMIKVRAGSRYEERDIDLFADHIEKFAPVAFPTSAPLEGTSKTHEWQLDSAYDESKRPHKTIGAGSEIYIYCRDWTSELERSYRKTGAVVHPATGLTLMDRKGNMLVDFTDPSLPRSSGEDPWSACNVAVNPGIYYLRLETGSDQILQMSVVASANWQTQVFMLQHNYGTGEHDRRADLSSASVFMERSGKGFYSKRRDSVAPDDVNFRLTEIARQALKNDRRIINNDLINMLGDKIRNPMLGIYGAHLLLMDREPNTGSIQHVVNNLRNYIGSDHPDVEALALKVGLGSNYIFDMPPMLRRSWNYMLEASVKNPGLVPEDSMVSQISGLLWSEDPWLIWGELQDETQFNKSEKLMEQVQKYLAYEDDSTPIVRGLTADEPEATTLESFAPKRYKSFSDLSDKDKQQLVQATQVPLSKLNSMLNTLGGLEGNVSL